MRYITEYIAIIACRELLLVCPLLPLRGDGVHENKG